MVFFFVVVVLFNINIQFTEDRDDDGEDGGSNKILHVLQSMKAMDVAVVVVRWYGGILLGPDRFKHIANATRLILEQENINSNNKPLDEEKRLENTKPNQKSIDLGNSICKLSVVLCINI